MTISCPRKISGFTAILPLLIIAITITVSLASFNFYRSNKYFQKAEKIASELGDEVNTLENGFKNLGTTVSTHDQGKRAPEKHLEVIKPAKSKIGNLQSEYENLSTPNKAKELDEKITNAFELANAFVKKYERTTQFNKDILSAYGDTLNNELDSFTRNYYRGGDRVEFITQTNRIEKLASDAIKKMQILNPSDDDKGYYDLMLKQLYNLKTSFSTLNYYYRNNLFDQALREVSSLTAKTESINMDIEQNAKKYVASSSTAKDLKKLKSLLEEIEDEYF